MAVTSIRPPSANATLGSALSDGNTYISWTYATRMYGSNACVASGTTAGNRGNVWTGCFSNQIPTGATITGVELVASGNSRFGNAGSTGVSEALIYQMRFYNGTSYSAPLVFLSTPSGGSLNGDSTQLTLTGGNKYYVNNTTGTDVLAGASDSLSGISWDPNDQADFGFAILTSGITDTPVGVILGESNMGLRITYQTLYTNTVIGIAPTNISKILGIATSAVSKVNTPGNTTEPSFDLLGPYQFEDETTSENTQWSPGNYWVNGSSAVNGTYWGRTSNKTVVGWRLGYDSTPSGTTGPDGSVNTADGTHEGTDADPKNYLFTETSSQLHSRCHVTRMPVFNSSNMVSTGNNLNLLFWVHAYGSQMGDLYVYIHTADTANHSSAVELAAYETLPGFSGQSSVWQQKTISLNDYRDDTDYYIYFVSQNATGFRADLAIDAVHILEGN
tara:strand:+ start:2344 stop:3681 length:1338 start_codon:yes stop_codon:yes gene_type:complete